MNLSFHPAVQRDVNGIMAYWVASVLPIVFSRI